MKKSEFFNYVNTVISLLDGFCYMDVTNLEMGQSELTGKWYAKIKMSETKESLYLYDDGTKYYTTK